MPSKAVGYRPNPQKSAKHGRVPYLDIVGVAGSIPVPPTIFSFEIVALRDACRVLLAWRQSYCVIFRNPEFQLGPDVGISGVETIRSTLPGRQAVVPGGARSDHAAGTFSVSVSKPHRRSIVNSLEHNP